MLALKNPKKTVINIKIVLGKTSSQKEPEPDKPSDQQLYDAYKKEKGKSAIYKRGGEWHESKEYQEWSSNYFATQYAELEEEGIVNGQLTPKEQQIADMGFDPKLQKLTPEEFQHKQTLKLLGISQKEIDRTLSKEKMKEELDLSDEEIEDMEKAVAIVNGEKPKPKATKSKKPTISGHELQAKISLYQKNMEMRCLFLYKLMGEKMEFIEELTPEELEYIKEIDGALKEKMEE